MVRKKRIRCGKNKVKGGRGTGMGERDEIPGEESFSTTLRAFACTRTLLVRENVRACLCEIEMEGKMNSRANTEKCMDICVQTRTYIVEG